MRVSRRGRLSDGLSRVLGLQARARGIAANRHWHRHRSRSRTRWAAGITRAAGIRQLGILRLDLGEFCRQGRDAVLERHHRSFERLLVRFARETIWFDPTALQRRARSLRDRLSVPQLIEVIGVTSLANGLCRMSAMVMGHS